MNAVSAEDVAACLDRAHDELLVRGRSVQYEDADGAVCVMNATGLGAMAVAGERGAGFSDRCKLLANAADDALKAAVGCLEIVEWNSQADDDTVLEACRTASKMLRNGELEVA